MEEKDKALVDFVVIIDYKKCDKVEDFAATWRKKRGKEDYDDFWFNEDLRWKLFWFNEEYLWLHFFLLR